MRSTDQKIIDTIIRKAQAECPDSLALIGVYGSAATGDLHAKSDLDLLILINDGQGRQLADGFILDDTGIGYDLYCTTWEMLERDAQCHHAQISKLMDSKIVYIQDQSAVQKLDGLRQRAASLLNSDTRFERSQAAYDRAKSFCADCFLADSMGQARCAAGAVINSLLDSVMLYHGKYFRKGIKRTFEELSSLELSFPIELQIMDVICAQSPDALQSALKCLMCSVGNLIKVPQLKAAPGKENLAGTYEEIYSNWRNKMEEAVENGLTFSSFMNMGSFQFMMQQVAEQVVIPELDLLVDFDPYNLSTNKEIFDAVLQQYLRFYEEAGIQPRHFINVEDFIVNYE